MKARALAIFDRTFRVTAVLQTIAGVVAGVGLLSAFAALALDRRQQLSALRILGAPGPLPRASCSWRLGSSPASRGYWPCLWGVSGLGPV